MVTTRNLTNTLLFLVCLIFFYSYSLAQNAPYARISSGEIDARIYLPDSEIGYYRGARFDWAGVVCQLEFRGHSYFGQWFKTYGPEIHDAIMGPVEAFDPLGYEDKTEKVFTKIGIGQLERLDTLGYRFSKPYKIVDHGEWTVKLNSGAVEFTQTLGGRYSYEYKKTIRLNNNKMIIEHLLKNTGEKTIDTKVFDHNFFVIDNDQVGPGYLVKFPFEIKGGSAGLKEFAEVDGNKIRFIKPLGKNDHPSLRSITGYGPLAKDYDIIIENTNTGAGVRVTADKPLSEIIFWSAIKTLSPEPYIDVNVKPSESFSWTITYDFYIIK